MVDFYGNWTYEPNTLEKDKCDCDRIADEVMKYLDNLSHNHGFMVIKLKLLLSILLK